MLPIGCVKRAKSTNMAAANKNEKQVMDISKPGKAAPPATAKPVIVGHKPMVQDPMVAVETDPEAEITLTEETSAAAAPSVPKKIIAPLSNEQPQDDAPAQVQNEQEESSSATKDSPEPQSEEAVIVDAVIDQVQGKKEALEPNDEERKKLEHIEKLIAEKKYFVPIGKVNGKSSHTVSVVTLLLLVVFLGLIAAIDAELLDPGFKLPVDIL